MEWVLMVTVILGNGNAVSTYTVDFESHTHCANAVFALQVNASEIDGFKKGDGKGNVVAWLSNGIFYSTACVKRKGTPELVVDGRVVGGK